MALNKPRVLITGITGFLGSHITNLLLQQMPSVAIIGTTKSSKNVDKVSDFNKTIGNDIVLIDADMFQSKECFTKGDMLNGIDYVFHTAAPLIVGGSK
jgi:nucleoside-diphosphate-sugar epimerase